MSGQTVETCKWCKKSYNPDIVGYKNKKGYCPVCLDLANKIIVLKALLLELEIRLNERKNTPSS